MQYSIEGEPFPVVICTLESGESMVTEGGAMVWMTPNMDMSTSGGGTLGKAMGRMFSGDSVFQNIYTARGSQGMIAFGSSFPGQILPIEITPDRPMVVQKSGFLCSVPTVDLSVFFHQKISSGLFGGEGLVMQKLSGHGMAFVELDGYIKQYYLEAGQRLLVSTGNLAMCDASCKIEIASVKGLKNKMLGGEGFFNLSVSGPGNVWVQSHPASVLAEALQPYMATTQ